MISDGCQMTSFSQSLVATTADFLVEEFLRKAAAERTVCPFGESRVYCPAKVQILGPVAEGDG